MQYYTAALLYMQYYMAVLLLHVRESLSVIGSRLALELGLWCRPIHETHCRCGAETAVLLTRHTVAVVQRLQTYSRDTLSLWCRDCSPTYKTHCRCGAETADILTRHTVAVVQRLQTYLQDTLSLWCRDCRPILTRHTVVVVQRLQTYSRDTLFLASIVAFRL